MLFHYFQKMNISGRNNEYQWQCVKCGNIFKSKIYTTHFTSDFDSVPRCLKCYKRMTSSSLKEKELLSYIKSIYFNEILENDRKIIYPLELDIVLPKINLAFEFNGNYWHQEGINKPIGYHEMKINLCKDKGIKLIYIWEDDWDKNKNEIKNNINTIIKEYIK